MSEGALAATETPARSSPGIPVATTGGPGSTPHQAPPTPLRPPRRRWRRRLLWLYLLLLAASHAYQLVTPGRSWPAPEQKRAEVRAVDGRRTLERKVSLAYFDLPATQARADGASEPLPVILIHGSPAGAGMSFGRFFPEFVGPRRVIAPDLPGFGGSTIDVPDYSVRAGAVYLLQLMDQLEIERAHVVGYSQGGGVAIEMADMAPERLASLVLMAGIGVQELELLGDYTLNHMLYGLQLAALQSVDWLLPHFGGFDRFPLNHAYARNYFDSDQRPLRAALLGWQGPSLILHGERDHQVPMAAALEHQRIVPQSELVLLEVGHGMTFNRAEATIAALALEAWLREADAGRKPLRAQADSARIQEAELPPAEDLGLRAEGGMLWLLMIGLALATLVSEDLTSISAGLMVSRGSLGLWPALIACFLGILAGDILLYAGGRLLGGSLLRRAPLRWLVRESSLARGREWFAHRGPAAILGSRFVPGLRFPTYVAAGMLRAPFGRVLLWFAVAAAIWVPILVGGAAWLGMPMLRFVDRFHVWSFPLFLGILLSLILVSNILLPATTWRGRRRLLGRWRRLRHWEFWPAWAFYPPIVAWILWLGIKHRSLTLFTACNPAMPASGFIGESKHAILSALAASGAPVPAHRLLPAGADIATSMDHLDAFMASEGLNYPIVLKPDAGQRGAGVAIVQNRSAAQDYLAAARQDSIGQAFAPGAEFGVFYVRLPGQTCGRIFSVTEKRMTAVQGDGRDTLGDLILRDDRAFCMAERFEAALADRLYTVPAAGEGVALVEIGTHSRGATFYDGSWILSPALEDAIDRISRGYEGFYFGRYDLRAESIEALREGRGFHIVELNGVTSEATHIYDPEIGLREAWRTLRAQWRIAFAIGAANRSLGYRVTPVRGLLSMLLRYRRTRQNIPEPHRRQTPCPPSASSESASSSCSGF